MVSLLKPGTLKSQDLGIHFACLQWCLDEMNDKEQPSEHTCHKEEMSNVMKEIGVCLEKN